MEPFPFNHQLSYSGIGYDGSQSRNANLAALFYRMHYIESYGTGIGKIKRGYKDYSSEPTFETAPGVFRVTLPNRNELPLAVGMERISGSKGKSLEDEKNLILDFVSDNGSITRKQTEDLIDAGTTKAFRLLRELCESGKLIAVGKGKTSKYVLK